MMMTIEALAYEQVKAQCALLEAGKMEWLGVTSDSERHPLSAIGSVYAGWKMPMVMRRASWFARSAIDPVPMGPRPEFAGMHSRVGMGE